MVNFLEAVKKARDVAKPRKFKQSFDIQIGLKKIDLTKPENQLKLIIDLPHKIRDPKICAFVDKELALKAKEVFSKVILPDEMSNYDKKSMKKLAKTYDFFVAQASLMSKVATTFGKVLGPKGKMPDPKMGAVITPNTDLQKVKDRLSNIVKVSVKKSPVINCKIGTEDMSDEDVADNAAAVYEAVKKALPLGSDQIKHVYVKLTMGKSVMVV